MGRRGMKRKGVARHMEGVGGGEGSGRRSGGRKEEAGRRSTVAGRRSRWSSSLPLSLTSNPAHFDAALYWVGAKGRHLLAAPLELRSRILARAHFAIDRLVCEGELELGLEPG